MKAGISSLPLRSSPTSRRVLPRAGQLAHVHLPTEQSHIAVGQMLQRAKQDAKPAAQSHGAALAKQLFPSSSPSSSNSDIRDQFKRTNSTSYPPPAVSARTQPSFPYPLDNRSVNLQHTGFKRTATAPKGSLPSLYANTDSFKSESSSIDLTGPDIEPVQKMHEPVYFAEDDFSDDADLDLEFKAPVALPPQPKPAVKENAPPPLMPTQNDVAIPWSSSPASHFLPGNPGRTVSAASNNSQSSLKRESSGDNEPPQAPMQKKAKRRVLPASFRNAETEEGINERSLDVLRTPAQKSKGSKEFWNPSASTIKEQKKILKTQRNPRNPEPETEPVAEKMHDVDEHAAAKPVAISLTREQENVLDMVVNQNKSVFFTGPAGTGKSVLMRAIIGELKQKYARDPERVAVTASTGLAACNIGGITPT